MPSSLPSRSTPHALEQEPAGRPIASDGRARGTLGVSERHPGVLAISTSGAGSARRARALEAGAASLRCAGAAALALAASLGLVVGCDDEPFGPSRPEPLGGPPPENPTACDVAARITEVYCTGCHGGGTAPLLTRDGLDALIDAESHLYPPAKWIVPGDAQASLLYRKVSGPGAEEGARMPLGGSLDEELVAMLADWINGGAPTACEAPTSEGEGEGEGDGGGEGEGEPPPENPTACDVAARITEVKCTTCHGAGGTAPLLTREGLAALINAESTQYAPAIWLVPGDKQASLLYRKVAGPGAQEGARMPLGQSPLADDLVTMLGAWIDGGAATACDAPAGEGEGEGEGDAPLSIAPGKPIGALAPADGYSSVRPSFVEDGPCGTGEFWQSQGRDNEGSTMNPGLPCIACHAAYADRSPPKFSFAGTVMAGLRDVDGCRGVPGVTVEILNGNNEVAATAVTNAAGNFLLANPTVSPFRVRLSYEGRQREMFGHKNAVGDCNACHSAAGSNGAPGRVVAP